MIFIIISVFLMIAGGNTGVSPIILVTYQLIARAVGSNVTLECHTEANPTAETFWMRGRHLISTNERHNIVTSQNGYTTFSELTIVDLNKTDFGDYKCLSKNLLGETAGTIILEEYHKIKTTKLVISSTPPVIIPNNELPSQRTRDEEIWEESKFPKLNLTSIYMKGPPLLDIYNSKIHINNSGSKFSTTKFMSVFATVAFFSRIFFIDAISMK